MLRMILGAAGSGQSDMLVKDMVERSMSFPDETFFVIVPEQATLAMQQNVVSHLESGATFNIDVVSFDRLARVVFSDLGLRTDNVLDDTGKVLILRQVLEKIKDDLVVYGKKVPLSGFTHRIKSAITELRQYGIDDNGLYLMEVSAEAGKNDLLRAKLQDLRLILKEYREAIRGTYYGMEELLDLFASHVSESERLRNAHFYLDGFTGFTPVQGKLLTELLKVAKDVTCALTIPKESVREHCPEYDLFYLSNQTLMRLKHAAEEAGCEIADPVFADRNKKPAKAEVFAASDLEAEVTFAAKEILSLVSEENYRFRDIAVITSDMESYHATMEKVFAEAEVPCFLDYKETVTDHPLARFLLSALQLSEQRFSFDSVFGFLKTNLTGLLPDEIALLENYCLEFGLHGKSAFENEFTKNRKLFGFEQKQEEDPEDPYAGFFWDLDRLNQIRSRFFESVRTFVRQIGNGTLPAGTFVSALKKLMEQNRIEEKLLEKAEQLKEEKRQKEEKEYRQIFARITALLDQTAALSGEGTFSVREYSRILESGLSEIRLGIIPPTLDAVVAGDLTRTRLGNVRALFFLGADDGRIPRASEPTGIFSVRDREFLKQEHFEMAPTPSEHISHQRFYLYLMFAKPSDHLFLSYAGCGADGQEAGPSYILDELSQLLPGAEAERRSEARPVRWEKDALARLSASLRKEPDERLLSFFAMEDPAVLSRIVNAAFYTNEQTDLDERVALDLYGEVLSGSVSRYEKFSECPFEHFLRYGVRLEKRPEYEIAATDVGTVYHDSLERYSRKLKEAGLSFRDVSDEDSARIAQESVKEALSEVSSDVWDSSSRNEFFLKRITEVTLKTTDVLRSQVKKGLYDPDEYELEFRESLGSRVRFKGKIDRVDLYDGEDLYVKIIDYKSGNKEFKIADIYNGLQLQLVAYLKEAVKIYREKNPDRKVYPGGVYYYRINDRFEKDEEALSKRFQMSGLTSCEEGLLAAVDEDLGPQGRGESSIVPVKLTQKGISSYSPVANREEFSHLMEFAGKKIEEISERILEGNIAVRPYYEGEQKNACRYCDYKDVCKFEAGSFGSDWKETKTKDKKEMEAEIYGRVSPE